MNHLVTKEAQQYKDFESDESDSREVNCRKPMARKRPAKESKGKKIYKSLKIGNAATVRMSRTTMIHMCVYNVLRVVRRTNQCVQAFNTKLKIIGK